jgi:hypothetical protein
LIQVIVIAAWGRLAKATNRSDRSDWNNPGADPDVDRRGYANPDRQANRQPDTDRAAGQACR